MEETNKKRAQSSYTIRKDKKLVPPTGSTFVNHTTVRTKVCNLEGFKDDAYFSNGHKGQHATFGRARGEYNVQNRNQFCYTALPRVDKENERHPPIETIPKKGEIPIMNLRSNVNFVVQNQFSAQKLKPKKPAEQYFFTSKKVYGQVPHYLERIKADMQQELEYIKRVKEEETKS